MAEQSLNGVDVAKLRESMDALSANPELARFEFRAHNDWRGGGKNETELTSFYGAGAEQGAEERCFVEWADEPPALLGQDMAPNPVEHLLTALAGCMSTAMVYHAAARGIQVEEVESELKGDLDLRGFLGVADDVRPGYSHIDVRFKVKSDAPADELKELCRFSPVYDVVSRGTEVEVHVEKKD